MKIDRYEVMHREDGTISCLDECPNHSVFKAMDMDLRIPVILKVIRPGSLSDESARNEIAREARAMALVRHGNIAQVYRFVNEEKACFFAREYIEGETAQRIVMADGPMTPRKALSVALQVARALEAMKKMDLAHRNIRPSSIMVSPEGAVKLIGFELARIPPNLQGDAGEAASFPSPAGSPEYASPEQLNEEFMDVASDMYSLGASLWFLLTGRPPFRGPAAHVMAHHLQSAPPFDELPSFPPEILNLLAHLLEKDPARRPAAPSALVTEIERCLANLGPEFTGPSALASPKAAPVNLSLPKMTSAREPVEEMPRRFLFGEALAGTVIAIIVYFILSRPIETPPAAAHAPAALPSASMPAVSGDPVEQNQADNTTSSR